MANQPRTVADVVARVKEKYPLPVTDFNWKQLREDPDFFDTVMEAVAGGYSVSYFAQSVGLNGPKLATYLKRLTGEQAEQYAEARSARAMVHADQLLDIIRKVEEGELLVPAARMMADNLKWMAERMDPELWGNKLQVRADIRTSPEMHLEALRELAERLKAGDERPVIEGEIEPRMVINTRPEDADLGPDPVREKPAPKLPQPKKKSKTRLAMEDLLS